MKYAFSLVVLISLAACAEEEAAAPPPTVAEPSRVALAVAVLPNPPRDCEPLGTIKITSRGAPTRSRRAAAEIRMREQAVNSGANTLTIRKREYGANSITIDGTAFRCPVRGKKH